MNNKQFSDEIEKKKFIDKNTLLLMYSEEEIFSIVFGFIPVEFEYIVSPLRKDNNPGCWFERNPVTGKLLFRDFAYGDKPLDCFDVVQHYFKFSNFYETLEFIENKLGNTMIGTNVQTINTDPMVRKPVEILIHTRDFNFRDKQYWSKYQITKQNLIDDKVFPVKSFKLLNTKKGDVLIRTYDICYAYTNFADGKKKLYRPFQKGRKRFITNCKADDVGGITELVPFGRQLIITKSYKDWRVLKNQGLNVVWFQNEGMIPSKQSLLSLCKRFDTIIVLFDNDKSGLLAAPKVVNIINQMFPGKARSLSIPVSLLSMGITDPADMIYKQGKNQLHNFLKLHNLIL